ncbi:MAG: hypothetical protein IKS32_02380, partial [Solobacterium sp.]|nr:hypothetical protein [Solobacterium sp.]
PFDPDQVLTREWTAYTLMNLSDRDVRGDSNVRIRDLNASAFPKHVSAAVAEGLFSLDENERFCPKTAIDRNEALNCLGMITDRINYEPDIGSTADYDFSDDIEFTEETPLETDEEHMTALFERNADIRPGQYCTAENSEETEAVYRIRDVAEDEDGIHAEIEPAKAEDVFESIDAENSFVVDFTTAEIIDALDGTIIQAASDNSADTADPASLETLGYVKTHEINGYRISYSVTATGIKAEVTKKTPHGLNVTGNLMISSVKPSYRWKTENGEIRDGFFKMEFQSSENLGAQAESYKQLYGDFSRVDPKNFLGTIRNLFQEKNEAAEITLPLAKITVPVPASPVLTVSMQLQLTIRATGKAQLTLTQDNCIGMEIRDGHMRQISDCDLKANASLYANTSILGGVSADMKLAGMPLADITTEAGATAKADAVIHLYDSEQNHTVMKANDIPSDLIDDLADGNENVLTCADITAYKTIDIRLNSPNTLAGRAGLSRTIVLADENNGAIIPGINGHMENGHYVSKCTRKDREKAKEEGPVVESDQIRIQTYSLIADPGETKEIRITALPQGYSAEDLVFTSDSPSVASVSGNRVTAQSEGAAIIRISTADGKYTVSCSILVRHKA